MKKKEGQFLKKFLSKFPKGIKILDAGCGDLKLVEKLESLGFEAWALDLLPLKGKHYVREDMRKTSFPDKFFDIILCINTLENVGIGDYGEEVEFDGDYKAVKEFERILKDDGKIVIMVAFGEACLKQRRHRFRVYNEIMLRGLIQKLKIKESHYFYYDGKTETWRETIYPKQVIGVFSKETLDWMGNVILVLEK